MYESRKINEIEFSDKAVSLFTFFLQLVSYLKSVGTVAAIDINAYLEAINAKLTKIFKVKVIDIVNFYNNYNLL